MKGLQRLNIAGKLFHIFAAMMFLYLLLPVILSVLVSFTPSRFIELPKSFSLRWYKEFFESAKWLNGLKNSFYIGLLNTVISMVVGMSTAIAFVRFRFKWKTTLNTFVLVPVFIPAVILGMGLLSAYYKMHLWGTYVSIAIAHALWSVPLVFMVLKVSLEGVDRTFEEAARGLGANGVRTFFEVTLPLIMPGILVGILFSFIISINEFVMALFLTTARTETLPKVIWPNLRYLLTPLVAAASGVLTLLTVVGLMVSAKLFNLGKIMERKS
jgi:ABC-type spermidine/putrescine transport system permease subunit II